MREHLLQIKFKDRFKSIKPKGIDTMANTKTTKLTKSDRFTALRAYLDANPDAVFHTPKGDITAKDMGEFVAHEIELLSKKNSADKKPTAQQTANAGIQSAIVEGMKANRLYTVTEIIKEIPECADLTNQRVSALLRQMIERGEIVRTTDKQKAYFSLPKAE